MLPVFMAAVLGPFVAIALMLLLASDIRTVLLLAAPPTIAAVIVLLVFVREGHERTPSQEAVSLKSGSALRSHYWGSWRSGDPDAGALPRRLPLVLRAQDLGVALAMVPIGLVVTNLAYTAIAQPAGVAADHGRL